MGDSSKGSQPTVVVRTMSGAHEHEDDHHDSDEGTPCLNAPLVVPLFLAPHLVPSDTLRSQLCSFCSRKRPFFCRPCAAGVAQIRWDRDKVKGDGSLPAIRLGRSRVEHWLVAASCHAGMCLWVIVVYGR